MSVVVEIDIASGAARRRLHIENVSPTLDLDAEGHRSNDQVCDYTVICTNGSRERWATFQHRYGDDATVLIGKAGAAIRAAHGVL